MFFTYYNDKYTQFITAKYFLAMLNHVVPRLHVKVFYCMSPAVLFKIFSFGKYEKYENYREKFSFTRKVKVISFVTVLVKVWLI